MARIAGVDLPVQKRLWVGLTAIYGIGQERAHPQGSAARRGGGEEEGHGQEGLVRVCRGAACCAPAWQAFNFWLKKEWSESCQRNRKPLLERRRPEPRQNRQRRQSAKKNSRRSVSAAPFRTAWCTSPRRSTTRRSPSRTRMGAP